MKQLEFEKKLMVMLLAGDDPILEGLRYQYDHSVVESRKFTGAGFFTHFKIKNGNIPVANAKSFQITDVGVTLNGVKNAIGVVLFIENGFLSFLEGYTMVLDFWPEQYSNVVLEYIYEGGKRDLAELKAKWS